MESEQVQHKRMKWPRLRVALRKIRDGKFFPRRFFINNWSVLVSLCVVFVASIAHRNAYLIQLNRIIDLEEQLVNRRTDRHLLEQEYSLKVGPTHISNSVTAYGLPLQPAPEARDEVIVTPTNE